MENFQKGSTHVWLVVIIVVLLVSVGYFAFVKKPATSNQQTISMPEAQNQVPASIIKPQVNQTTNVPITSQSVVSPSVNIISPNGGENLKVGSTYSIKWTSNPARITSPSVGLYLYDTQGHNALQIAPSVSLTGTYDWNIPSTVKYGSYKISAYLSGLGEGAGGAIQDYSDNYFTITK
jgi:hypothetical protein